MSLVWFLLCIVKCPRRREVWWRKSSRTKPDPLCLEHLIHLSIIRNHLRTEVTSMGQGCDSKLYYWNKKKTKQESLWLETSDGNMVEEVIVNTSDLIDSATTCCECRPCSSWNRCSQHSPGFFVVLWISSQCTPQTRGKDSDNRETLAMSVYAWAEGWPSRCETLGSMPSTTLTRCGGTSLSSQSEGGRDKAGRSVQSHLQLW